MTYDERKLAFQRYSESELADLRDLFRMGPDYTCYAQPVVVASVLVEYEDTILLLRRSEPHNDWLPPGGKVRLYEHPVAAAVRAQGRNSPRLSRHQFAERRDDASA